MRCACDPLFAHDFSESRVETRGDSRALTDREFLFAVLPQRSTSNEAYCWILTVKALLPEDRDARVGYEIDPFTCTGSCRGAFFTP